MKAKLIREMEGRNPEYSAEARLTALAAGDTYDVPEYAMLPAGTVIEHEQAFRLVQMGVAIPDDDECEQRADRTPEQIEAAQRAYGKLSKGKSTGDKKLDADGKDAGGKKQDATDKKPETAKT